MSTLFQLIFISISLQRVDLFEMTGLLPDDLYTSSHFTMSKTILETVFFSRVFQFQMNLLYLDIFELTKQTETVRENSTEKPFACTQS